MDYLLPSYKKYSPNNKENMGTLPSVGGPVYSSQSYEYNNNNNGYVNQNQQPLWVNPYNSIPNNNNNIGNSELRFRQNSLLLQQPPQPNYFQYANTYSMQQCDITNGICGSGSAGLIQVHSPGLKEVLASHIPGPTVLYMEPKKNVTNWFKLTSFVIILLLSLAGLIMFATLYLGGDRANRNAMLNQNGEIKSETESFIEEIKSQAESFEEMPDDQLLPLPATTTPVPEVILEQMQSSEAELKHTMRSPKVKEVIKVVYSRDGDDEEAIVEIVSD